VIGLFKMPLVYFFIILILFMGCSKKTTSPAKVNSLKKQALTSILRVFSQEIKYSEKYKIEMTLIETILSDINSKLYGSFNKNAISVYFVKDNIKMAMALPNDNILVTTNFLEAIKENYFTKDEIKAIMCHESSHILNDDWTNSFRDTYSSIDYQIVMPDPISFFSSYGLTKLLSSKNIGLKEYSDIYASLAMQSSFTNENNGMQTKINKNLDVSFFIQGFPLEMEIEADRMAKECLSTINVNSINMSKVLEKLLTLEEVHHPDIKTRLKKIQGD